MFAPRKSSIYVLFVNGEAIMNEEHQTAQEKSAKPSNKHLQLQDRDRETALREILRDNPQIEIIRSVFRQRWKEEEHVPTRVRSGYVK